MASKEDFVFLVAAHAGVSVERAARATEGVLAGIGAYLTVAHREFVADELGPGLTRALHAGTGLEAPLDERVLEPGTTAGQARELIASVCHALAEALSAQALLGVRRCTPPEIAEFLVPGAPEAPRRAAPGAHRETLAAGRPGSRHPASEARPDRTHPESVAAANPHAATKLSSTTGSTQERLGETFAGGHLDSAQTIAGSRR